MSDIFGGIVSNALDVLGPENFRMGLHEIVRGGLGLGLSGNEIQQQLAEVGQGVQRQRLQSLIRTVRAETSLGELGPPVDLNALPSGQQIVQVPEGRQGMFRTNIRVTFSQRIGPGEYQTEQTTFSVASTELISPQEAIDAAHDIWSTHAELYGDRELFGLEYTGTIENLGRAG